jgi:glycosyltransferase involved in cell wall biosynthesis
LFAAHEDFGIAPVEAQACGTPVIAFGQGGATETLLAADEEHIGTAAFFAEQTAASLAEAIRWFEARPQQFSPTLARRNAERFERSRFEQELLNLVKRVADDRHATAPRKRAA